MLTGARRAYTFVGLTLSASLGERTSASLSITATKIAFSNPSADPTQLTRVAMVSVTIFRLRRPKGESSRDYAQVMAQSDYGHLRAEVARFAGDTAYRLSGGGMFYSAAMPLPHDELMIVLAWCRLAIIRTLPFTMKISR